MFRKIIILLCLCVFCFNLSAAELTEKNGSENEAGMALLDSIVIGFAKLAKEGSGGYKSVYDLIQEQMAELKKARAQKQVDPVFFKRYKKILVVIFLAMFDPSLDSEGILDSFIVLELKEFIDNVTGMDEELSPPKHRGIATIASALSEELLNLYIYLDSKNDREQLRKKYFKE